MQPRVHSCSLWTAYFFSSKFGWQRIAICNENTAKLLVTKCEWKWASLRLRNSLHLDLTLTKSEVFDRKIHLQRQNRLLGVSHWHPPLWLFVWDVLIGPSELKDGKNTTPRVGNVATFAFSGPYPTHPTRGVQPASTFSPSQQLPSGQCLPPPGQVEIPFSESELDQKKSFEQSTQILGP